MRALLKQLKYHRGAISAGKDIAVAHKVAVRSMIVALAYLITAMPSPVSMITPAEAQTSARGGLLNPFPKDDTYRLHLVGDWLADGLQKSLAATVAGLPRVRMQRNVLTVRSLRQSSWQTNISKVKERAANSPIDIAVVFFGVTEVGSVFRRGRRLRFGTEAWQKQYARRIDRLMKELKASKGVVYWLGLPVVRRSDQNEVFREINAIVRERAYINGVAYIDVYSSFADESGNYSRYGPDLAGKIQLLRSKDGTYFTRQGNMKLAHFATRLIRRDLKRAKAEQVVELAGDEAEQQLVRRAITARAGAAGTQRAGAPARSRRSDEQTGPAKGPISRGIIADAARFGDQKADHGTVTVEVERDGERRKLQIKLPRPAISAAVMALVTRKQSPDRPARLGDSAVQVIAGGVPLLSTITPSNPTYIARRRNLSPTQSVFFKVWGKGERLPPREGRADDLRWPRPEPVPVVRVSASARRARQQPTRASNLPPLPVKSPFR